MLLAGTQKAFALPPGTAVFVCSPAALAKAATVKDRGYYFDFLEFQKNAETEHDAQHAEHRPRLRAGFQARRHFRRRSGSPFCAASPDQPDDPRLGGKHMASRFSPNPASNRSRSPASTTAPSPAAAVVDVPKLQKLVKDQGFLIDGGYGKIKGTTFRISNMGDETRATMQQLFAALDNAMKQL